MMTSAYLYVEPAAAQAGDAAADSIVSKAVLDAKKVRAAAFSFAAGQEMLKHNSGHAAIVYVLADEGEIVLGGCDPAFETWRGGLHAAQLEPQPQFDGRPVILANLDQNGSARRLNAARRWI